MQLKLSALVAVVAALSVQALSGGYIGSCHTCDTWAYIDTIYLRCTCGNGQGDWNAGSIINLNKCFGNHDGDLVYQVNGGFVGSCNNIGLVWGSDTHLKADCGDGHGGWRYNEINLNDYIGNTNSNLVC